jgi:hypothetical protein
VVKEVQGREALEISLIENLQREDLNPIEAAEAFKHLIEEFHISQEDLSKRIGKDRTTITNTLRLLKLPLEVRNQLLQNRITSGHARALLSLESKEKQKELCALIIKKGLSVREAEAIAKRWSEKPKKSIPPMKKQGGVPGAPPSTIKQPSHTSGVRPMPPTTTMLSLAGLPSWRSGIPSGFASAELRNRGGFFRRWQIPLAPRRWQLAPASRAPSCGYVTMSRTMAFCDGVTCVAAGRTLSGSGTGMDIGFV